MVHARLLVVLVAAAAARAQSSGDLDESRSEMRRFVERYATDRDSLHRRYRVPMSPVRRERMRGFLEAWLEALEARPFEKMGRDGRIDWLLLRNELRHELRRIDYAERRDAETEVLLPFHGGIVDLAETRRRLESIDPQSAAEAIDALRAKVEETEKSVREGKHAETKGTVAHRAARRLGELRKALERWFRYYDGYHPGFSWWVRKPYEAADRALKRYAKTLRERLAKEEGDDSPIGEPIGREALLGELAHEMIPYSPEELIEIANREFAWCDAEMDKAAKELGFDDWRKAQDHVKSLHVEPGEQPDLIRDLALEAIAFVTERELLTVPPLCREIWRMEMMAPEQQKLSPYFLGGETIQIAFPTDTMTQGEKLMTLRGNNRHFARATVHHELIPGHHLQGFMTARHRTYRRVFHTPFWTEGWALYWETLLWDMGFQRSPEDRIGMLFWRKHRCARIVFSLSFHLKKMNAKEAVDFLVERVGHERRNAEAEVRRSVRGGYGPLYQAAYMLGGLQIRALRKELVGSGRMAERAFHDAILKENAIPIEMIRADLTGQELARDFTTSWRFYPLER